MSELKPCPFCGGPAMVTNPTMWQAWCTKCHSIGEPRLTKEEAIEAWNRRTNSTTIQPPALSTNLAEVGTDCISRQAAIDALHMHLMYRMGTDSNKKRLDEWINNLPSAQPEIIRCEDCKYRGVGDYCVYGTRLAWVTKSNDFCSKAERRTDEQTKD